MADAPPPDLAARGRAIFGASIALTAVILVVPYGHYVGYPLLLVSTVVHELGHGVAALLTGGRFEELRIWSDGSGIAVTATDGAWAHAIVCAGGLVGPAFAGALGFVAARRVGAARVFLVVVGVFLVVAEIVWVRTAFGLAFVGALAAACLYLGVRGSPLTAQTALTFLSVQLALSVYTRADYLFVAEADMGERGRMPSDVQMIADALVGPYWLWGIVCGATSLAALAVGAWLLLRDRRPATAR